MTLSRIRTREIVFLALALCGLALYSSRQVRMVQLRYLWHLFYKPARTEGISLKAENTLRHFREGRFTPWTYVTAREALTRWHLARSGNAPHAFDDLMARWHGGIWSCPPTPEWERELAAFDARWSERRASHSERWTITGAGTLRTGWTIESTSPVNMLPIGGGALAIVPASGTVDSLTLRMPDTATDTIGDTLLVRGMIGDEETTAPLRLYWGTTTLGVSGWRVEEAIAAIDADGATEWTFGMSDEPGWLCDGARLTTVRLDFPAPCAKFRLLEISGTDSTTPRAAPGP